MLKNKFSHFLTHSGIHSHFNKSIATALAFAFSTSFFHPEASIKKYDQEYDLAVIGGGSGGLAAAFQANKYGLKVIVIDYVEETKHQTKWGLGGTCVNVGCIPKKLMHQASKSHDELVNSFDYGWVLPGDLNDRQKSEELARYFNWGKMRSAVQSYIKSINFGYIASINKVDHMDYLNCLATFKDPHTLICSKSRSLIKTFLETDQLPLLNHQNPQFFEIKAKHILIATGTRPAYLNCEGAHLAITSDDIFQKKDPPGKTLVVGGGYVAVEIAGFLKGMGYEVGLMTRGQYLRSFDRDMVKEVLQDLKQRNVQIIPTSLPSSLRQTKEGIEVITKNQLTGELSPPSIYHTVLFAVGRSPTTYWLNLDKIGLKLSESKKILTHSTGLDRTNIEHIYAVGDVVEGLPELTSTATKIGWALGRKIASKLNKRQFDQRVLSVSLQNYPTTIFSPLEYSCCGMSEEQAIKAHGNDAIEVYHIKSTPLEESLLDKYNEDGSNYRVNAYAKAIVHKQSDKVIGLHYAGPHAGEVMQGYAVAMRIGLTKHQLDSTIGIHPTSSEELTNMIVTKSSGEDCMKSSC